MGPGSYGLTRPPDARHHLRVGVGRALLGRLVEVDRDAVPLVEMHRARLVRERDVAQGALHVDARQHGDDVGGSDGAGGLDRPLPGVQLIPGEGLVDQRRVLVLLREEVPERQAHVGGERCRSREGGPDDADAALPGGLPEGLVDVVPAEHDVALVAGRARLRDAEVERGRRMRGGHDRIGLGGSAFLSVGRGRACRAGTPARPCRCPRASPLRGSPPRGPAERGVLGEHGDVTVVLLRHERGEGIREMSLFGPMRTTSG